VRGGWDSDRCRGRLGCSTLPLVWLGWQRAQDSGRRDPAHHCEVRCDPTERCHCRSAKPHAVRSMGHVVHVVRCTLCVAARAATEAMRTLVRSELDCFGTRRRGGKRSRDGADIATEEYDIELKTSRDVSSDRVPPARPPAALCSAAARTCSALNSLRFRRSAQSALRTLLSCSPSLPAVHFCLASGRSGRALLGSSCENGGSNRSSAECR
jgi:hypothetical protein